jgi:5-methyltetrahydropteroyltriglutamate--homocysteine methyltransferase
MALQKLPTSLVGSYAQPNWLIDKSRLGKSLPPRVVLNDLWRIEAEHLEEAQNDATLIALDDQHRAGVDIVTDGEMRRESYSNRFANALSGIDLDHPGKAIDRTGKVVPVPRVTGEIKRSSPVELPYVAFLKAHTDKPIKLTLPGPFTMTQQAKNDYYPDDGTLAMAYAVAVNEELKALFAAGIDIIQLDEPYVQARPEAASEYAVQAINRAMQGATGTTVLHVCFGYGKHVADKPAGYAFLDELDASEADEIVAERIQAALAYLPPERLVVAPDCGMKYLSRKTAFSKLSNMVAGRNLITGQKNP